MKEVEKMVEKKCEYCGSTKDVHYSSKFDGLLCRIHWDQYNTHGKFIKGMCRLNACVILGEASLICVDEQKHLWARVDTKHIDYLLKYTWNISTYGYAFNSKAGFMHRFIMNVTQKDIDIDHINHDVLDNREVNLRITTRQQNCWNSRGHKDAYSKFKGVSLGHSIVGTTFYRAIGRWEEKYVSIGNYSTELESAYAYNLWAKDKFKEYAYLNTFTKDEKFKLTKLLPLRTLEDKKNEKKTSKYKYISYCKDKACWCYSRVISKIYYRKRGFKTEEEAHDAYIERMKEIGVEP